MAVDAHELRIRRSLEEKLGMEEAAYLIERRPRGGWDTLVTKEYLDLRLHSLESGMDGLANQLRVEFRDQTTRMVKWLIPTVFAGMTVSTGLVAAILAVLA